MKKISFLLLVFAGSLSFAFDDALTKLRNHGPSTSVTLAFNSFTSADRAQSTIINHLKEIKASGELSSSIAMGSYWKEVFSKAGSSHLYPLAENKIVEALTAGLAPYFAGKTITAQEFADGALKVFPETASSTQ